MLGKIINLTVFFTGGAVLVLEVSATRTLSPYFGNTIFTVSSILSVVLGALALGYLLGGKLADRYPKINIFFGIIWFSGVTVLLINLFLRAFLNPWIEQLGNMVGPLVASIMLFFAPSLFLGMLSPFAIRLKSQYAHGNNIGSNSGEVFFFSTAGSILGSLATGFFFIPNIGVSKIIMGTGLSLIIVGCAGILFSTSIKKHFARFILLSFAILVLSISLMYKPFSAGEIYHEEGTYERISIVDNAPNFEDTRTLFLDKSASSAVFLKDGSPLATPYAKYLNLANALGERPKHILVLGGGGYAIPRYAKTLFPDAEIDVVEIEPRLFDLAKRFFYLSETYNLNNYIQDGRTFLANTQKNYDLVFVDVYSSFLSIPSHMTTIEFFTLLHSHVKNGGMVLMNVVGSLNPEHGRFLASQVKTFSSVFTNKKIFALFDPQSLRPQNFVFLGFKNSEFDYFKLAFDSSQDAFLKTISYREIEFSKLNLDKAILLTDDFSPVEYLVAPLVALY